MKKIFLTSSFQEVATKLAEFEKDLKGRTITFIPTASKVEKVTFYVKAAQTALEQLGLHIDILDLSTASREESALKLKKNDYIYVSGGNTFFLLQEMRKKGADQVIVQEVNRGKLYIGESAGSMITSKNIAYVKDMDSISEAPELKDLDALDLVDFYIIPHFNNFPFKKIAHNMQQKYSSTLNTLPISNHEAVTIWKNEVNIL